MIFLVTGLPGSFKTTWVLRELGGAAYSGRRIFSHGVNGLKVAGVEEISADQVRDWRKLPTGSVVLVDEAQKLFPSRGMHSGKPSQWIEDLAEHRHDGYDFLLLTQHPTFIDPFVRKLAGRHIHLARRFGMERATVFAWEEVKSPESSADKAMALKTTFSPVAEDYSRHESATLHTHKRRLPWKKFGLLGAGAAGVLVSVVLVVRHVNGGFGVELKQKFVDSPRAESGAYVRGGSGGVWSVARRKPRMEFQKRAESAPMFDELQQVKSQPRVAGCLDFGVPVGGRAACYCVTGQGLVLSDISVHECRVMMRSGWQDETRETFDSGSYQRARLDALDGVGSGAKKAPPAVAPQGPGAAPDASGGDSADIEAHAPL